jgi:hypothetical protein
MMSEHDVEKLLGGFAADTLTPEERHALYNAALLDQRLFDTLADEQALKELLNDPAVRRRLLEELKPPGTSARDNRLSWLGWFGRPAGLAFAGGLAAVIFAVAFGTKIYQESLYRAAPSTAIEAAKPAAPPTPASEPLRPARPSDTEPQLKAKENVGSSNASTKNEGRADDLVKRERKVAPTAPQEQETSDSAPDRPKQQVERDETRRQVEKSLAPAAATPAPHPLQAPANAPTAAGIAPIVSARALFYGGEANRSDQRTVAEHKAADAAARPKPLGLRYSFVVRGRDGQEREVTAATAAKRTEPARLTVEATQDAYLQVLKTVGSSGARLWWPQQETGKISLKLLAGQRTDIPLPPPAENEALTLTIRLSPKPFGPLTIQEAAMLDRFSADLLIEPVSPGEPTGLQEQATYVVSRDPSPAAQMAIEIPFY